SNPNRSLTEGVFLEGVASVRCRPAFVDIIAYRQLVRSVIVVFKSIQRVIVGVTNPYLIVDKKFRQPNHGVYLARIVLQIAFVVEHNSGSVGGAYPDPFVEKGEKIQIQAGGPSAVIF